MALVLTDRARTAARRTDDRARTASRRREALAGWLFVAPTLVIFAAFKILPILGAGAMSLTTYRLNGEVTFTGGENYAELVADDAFWASLRVSLVYAVIFVPLILAVSLAGAVLLDRLKLFVGLFRSLLFVPYLTSFVMAGIIWTWIFASDGPINAMIAKAGGQPIGFVTGDQLLVLASLAVVAVWKGFGYSMLIFLAGLKSQPAEIHEAARMDGAGPWRAFWQITFPMLRPVTFFVLVIETIVAFQVFDTIYVMTGGGPNRASLSLIYLLYDEGFKFFDFGYASAIGIVLFVVVLALSLVQRRFAGKEL
ncbi:carbohydrate ABC transporter permease [Kribbella endophytica]